jgi:hypothetical protein
VDMGIIPRSLHMIGSFLGSSIMGWRNMSRHWGAECTVTEGFDELGS